MTKMTIVATLLAACAPAPHAATSPPAAAPSPPAAAPPVASRPPPAPRPDLIVWTSYTDFSGHGFKGSGRYYRLDAGVWLAADCQVSSIADPEAHTPTTRTCSRWTEVPADLRSAVDQARALHQSELECGKYPAVCASLGLTLRPHPDESH